MSEHVAGRLTERARSLLRAIAESELELASIWREPFETYDPAKRLDWMNRQVTAAKAYRALLDQV